MTQGCGRVRSAELALVPRAAVIGVAVLLIVSCGGDGPVSKPSLSRSVTTTRSPATASEQPSLTRTEAASTRPETASNSPDSSTRGPGEGSASAPAPASTSSPTPPSTATPNRTPSASPARTSTGERPGATVTVSVLPQPTSTAPVSSPAPSPTTVQPTAGAASETNEAPSWLWWLLGLLAIGAAIAVPYMVRRRRRAWEAGLAAAVEEVVWFARVLVPQLQLSHSADEVRGGWTVSAHRVIAVEDRLTGLQATAHREQDRARARTLRDMVRASRERIEVVSTGAVSDLAAELGRVASDLEGAVAAVSPLSVSPAPSTPG